jgi:hypothetical protein
MTIITISFIDNDLDHFLDFRWTVKDKNRQYYHHLWRQLNCHLVTSCNNHRLSSRSFLQKIAVIASLQKVVSCCRSSATHLICLT